MAVSSKFTVGMFHSVNIHAWQLRCRLCVHLLFVYLLSMWRLSGDTHSL